MIFDIQFSRMEKSDIKAWDWARILLGDVPGVFMLEVFLRAIVTFALLLTVLRLLGKKMNGQLNLTETAVMIGLGAIISIPMQTPDRGIAIGIVALLCVLACHRFINWLTVKSPKVENFVQGSQSIIVRDGVMDLKEMKHIGISKQNLFSELRGRGNFNLGKIKRVYFESCGMINVYEQEQPMPGLPLYPTGEEQLVGESRIDKGHCACRNCGFVVDSDIQSYKCPHCGEKQWVAAIL